jgi:hypothetical protein
MTDGSGSISSREAREAMRLLGWRPAVSVGDGLGRVREWPAGRIAEGVAVR